MTVGAAASNDGATCALSVDGHTYELPAGGDLLAALLEAGVYVPHLCHHPSLPDVVSVAANDAVYRAGVRVEAAGRALAAEEIGCGLCVVEVEGDDEPRPACRLEVNAGMVVRTDSEALRRRRQQRLAGILAHHPHACLTCAQREGCSREPCSSNVPVAERCCRLLGRCELEKVADYVGIPADTPRYVPASRPADTDDPLVAWTPELCIGCLRCVRACATLTDTGAMGWVSVDGRITVGLTAAARPTAACRYCGACVEACPTGALLDRDESVATVPCRSGCPAGMDVPRFLRAAAAGAVAEAAAVTLERLPLPEVLGRVCFHPCEASCRRSELGGPLSVCRVRRAVLEAAGDDLPAWPAAAASGRRVAVIGAGPAGLAAAHFLRRAGHDVRVLDAAPEPGGMLRYGIPAYRLPRAVIDRDLARLEGQGITFSPAVTVGRDLPFDDLAGEFDAVVVAVGLGAPRRLGLDGEDAAGVLHGLPFLRRAASGDLTPDHLAGRRVLVIGGGNVAVDAARTALRLDAAAVTIACLEGADEMPAYAEEVAAAREEGVAVLPGWGPEALRVEGGSVVGVRLVRCVRVFDERGRFAPELDHEVARDETAEVVIVAIGQRLDEAVRAVVERAGIVDEGGEVSGDSDGVPVIACGDVSLGPSSVVRAVADGRRVAEALDRRFGGSGEIVALLGDEERPATLVAVEGFADLGRAAGGEAGVESRRLSFAEVELGLGADAARAEAARCLQCDLRLRLAPPVLPPLPWRTLDAESVAEVPAGPGVYQLLGEDHVALRIAGVDNLRAALERELEGEAPAPLFMVEEDAMYTRRESELIQQFLATHGRMPGAGGADDLDDLF